MYSEIHNMCKSLYRVELFISVQIISSAFLFTRFTQLCQMRLKKFKYFTRFSLYNLTTLPPSPPPRLTPPISYCFLLPSPTAPPFNNFIFYFLVTKKTPNEVSRFAPVTSSLCASPAINGSGVDRNPWLCQSPCVIITIQIMWNK